jgi:hypothetical protein
MKKVLLVFLILTLLIAGVIYYFNRGERAPQAAALLPESTLLLLQTPDFPTARVHFETTPLAALWQEPEIQTALEQPLAAVRHFLTGDAARDDANPGSVPAQLLALGQGEVFLALTRVTTAPNLHLGLVLGCDTKLRKPMAVGYLKVYEAQLRKYQPSALLETKTYLGVTYHSWTIGPSQIHHTFFGSLFVATLAEDDLRQLITRATGHADPDRLPLAQSSRYTAVLRQLPANADTRLFLNVEQLVTNFGMLLLMAAQSSPAVQGLANLQAVAATYEFQPTGLIETSLITYKTDRPTVQPLALRTLAVAPADTAYYAAQAGNLASGFTTLMDTLAKSGNPQALQIGANLDKFLADAGVRLQDDFLAHLGPEIAYIANWREGAPYPDLALVAEINNRTGLTANLGKITSAMARAAGTVDELSHAGLNLHVIRTETTALAPTYVLTDNHFILALTPDYAKELATPSASLATAPGYRNAIRRLPPGGVSVTYADTAKLMSGLYRLAHTASGSNNAMAANLPAAETITRYLGPLASTTRETPRATTTTTHSTIGKPATIVVGLLGALAIAQPWLEQLLPGLIPTLPTTSSNTAAPAAPTGNPTATSQTPAP